MFSMCSELTPRDRIPDTRIPQLMQTCQGDRNGFQHRKGLTLGPQQSAVDVFSFFGGYLKLKMQLVHHYHSFRILCFLMALI